MLRRLLLLAMSVMVILFGLVSAALASPIPEPTLSSYMTDTDAFATGTTAIATGIETLGIASNMTLHAIDAITGAATSAVFIAAILIVGLISLQHSKTLRNWTQHHLGRNQPPRNRRGRVVKTPSLAAASGYLG